MVSIPHLDLAGPVGNTQAETHNVNFIYHPFSLLELITFCGLN